ncbi:biotin/lipoate--protein ligase family protein [Azospirillum sp. ST 5-10]|uniref:biotin/lipoate--protein ligase family protein n=1 Tax=unclassified Azospirillum TaxID=2630922 RepID=UPI003F49C1C0
MSAPAVARVAAPVLPPPFEPVGCEPGEDAFRRALAEAGAGAGAGRLVWGAGPDRLDVAVVLEPDTDLRGAVRAALAAQVAMAEALAALGPPHKPVSVRWPDGLAVDGAAVGRVRAGWPPRAGADAAPDRLPDWLPDWLVVGVTLRLRHDGGEPGLEPERTALAEEGFGDLAAADLVEAFARHLLHGLHRWEEEGFAPLARHWLARRDGDGALDPATGDRLAGTERHGLLAALAARAGGTA